MSALQIMLLPGIVLPADLAYSGLVTALGNDVATIVKDLEVYREDSPPPDYSLETEVVFADFTLEVFDERHHFDPPHRIEPERRRDHSARSGRAASRHRPAERASGVRGFVDARGKTPTYFRRSGFALPVHL